MISKNGLFGTGEYGTFMNYKDYDKRIVTLGRDTGESAVKTDYIDLAAYTHAKNASI